MNISVLTLLLTLLFFAQRYQTAQDNQSFWKKIFCCCDKKTETVIHRRQEHREPEHILLHQQRHQQTYQSQFTTQNRIESEDVELQAALVVSMEIETERLKKEKEKQNQSYGPVTRNINDIPQNQKKEYRNQCISPLDQIQSENMEPELVAALIESMEMENKKLKREKERQNDREDHRNQLSERIKLEEKQYQNEESRLLNTAFPDYNKKPKQVKENLEEESDPKGKSLYYRENFKTSPVHEDEYYERDIKLAKALEKKERQGILSEEEQNLILQQQIIEEQNECSICLAEISNPMVKTICGHEFHKACIQAHVKKNGDLCPNCRTKTYLD